MSTSKTALQLITTTSGDLVNQSLSGSELILLTDIGDLPGLLISNIGGKLMPFSNSGVTELFSAAGVLTIDLSLGDYYVFAATEDITSVIFTLSVPDVYDSYVWSGMTKTLLFIQDSTPRTFTMPAEFKWAGGTVGAVSSTAGAFDRITFVSEDDGTTFSTVITKDIKYCQYSLIMLVLILQL
jgi:hypothetical protein